MQNITEREKERKERVSVGVSVVVKKRKRERKDESKFLKNKLLFLFFINSRSSFFLAAEC